MRYALISDIHGNFPAFRAVLEDVKKRDVNKILLLGDYYQDFPYPNETVDMIKSLKNADAIRGNKEDALIDTECLSYRGKKQFGAFFYAVDNFTPENIDYLKNLQRSLKIDTDSVPIFMAHSIAGHFGIPESGMQRSSIFSEARIKNNFTHDEYLNIIKSEILGNTKLMEKITAYPDGVYAFGHSHLQWHARIRGKLLINPGACGLPLDFDTRAPYAVIDNNNSDWEAEEIRVAYDTEIPAAALMSSNLYAESVIWSNIILAMLSGARDRVSVFLKFVEEYAEGKGSTERPVTNEIWETAFKAWNESGNSV